MTADPAVEVRWSADDRPDDFRRLLTIVFGDEPSDPTPTTQPADNPSA